MLCTNSYSLDIRHLSFHILINMYLLCQNGCLVPAQCAQTHIHSAKPFSQRFHQYIKWPVQWNSLKIFHFICLHEWRKKSGKWNRQQSNLRNGLNCKVWRSPAIYAVFHVPKCWKTDETIKFSTSTPGWMVDGGIVLTNEVRLCIWNFILKKMLCRMSRIDHANLSK